MLMFTFHPSFNSRTREGCDLSIRPLAMSCTVFQFTHPGGVRHLIVFHGQSLCEFQFTHPGGVRQTNSRRQRLPRSSFNSRTREGCDLKLFTHHWAHTLFQFTHPGGVRHNTTTSISKVLCFNSRTREGCDVIGVLAIPHFLSVSIHAPGRGATYTFAETWRTSRVSIHAPGRGATIPQRRGRGRGLFQFTHPGGVRLAVTGS